MEYRILGPLEVFADGRAVDLAGHKQRALLAVLLLDANRVVSTDRLTDALWEEEPPRTAGKALQVYISELRKQLGKERVQTKAPGYQLRVEEGELDLERFQSLHAEGRHAEALSLWRGAPLGEFTFERFAQPEIARLGELRLACLEDRIEADLAAGRHAELVGELESLVRAHPLRARLRAQLMLALYRSGRQAEALDAYQNGRRILVDELGLEPSGELRELQQAILNQDSALDLQGLAQDAMFRRPVGQVGVGLDAPNPYKGLRSFGEADADDFFGRELLTAHLLDRLHNGRFLAVVGPSGSGKSSVVRAGLVPALRRGALPGSESWRIVDIVPGAYPLEELEAALLRVADNPPASLLEQLDDGERGLVRALKRVLPRDESEIVLVVDQLEELFTLVENNERRAHFLTIIERAVADPHCRLRVVTTLRADFYDRPLLYTGFAELMRDYVEAVVPLLPAEFERAIAGPGERVGAALEPGLLPELIADVADEPGSLPLLQYALTELYERREGNVLTRDAYRAIGGVPGALAGRAEEVHAGLSELAQTAARQLFLRLVTLGEGTEDTRRRVDRGELASIEIDQRAMAEAIDAFGGSRLLSFDRDLRTGEPTIEVAHEALLREWARLRRWIDAARDDVRTHRRLVTAAAEWADSNRDQSFLLRGGHLAQFESWSEESGLALTDLEHAFIDASSAEGRRELIVQQRHNRRLKTLLAGVGVLLAVAVVAGVVAFAQRRSARHEATVALGRELGSEAVIEPRIDVAMLLAREAVNLNRSPATEGTLLATLLRSPAAVAAFPFPIQARPLSMGVSPDGTTLAISDNQFQLRVFDTHAHREARAPLTNVWISAPPVYSKDGSLLAVLRQGGVGLLDARTFKTRRFLGLAGGSGGGGGVALFSPLTIAPDNKTVFLTSAAPNPDGSHGAAFLIRWNVATGKRTVSELGSNGMIGADLVAAGRRIVTITDTEITTWDARTLRRLHTIPVPLEAGRPVIAAVSPDGKTVAIGSSLGSVFFVDVADRHVTPGAGAHSGAVAQLVFSPDSASLVSAGDDAKIIVWDRATAQPSETLTGHGGPITAAALSRDGRTLYTASLDGVIFEWDLGARRRFGQPFTTMSRPTQVAQDDQALGLAGRDVQAAPPPLAVSPDGSEFAARVGTSSVGLFSTRTFERLQQFAVHAGGNVIGLAWSSAGQIAVTGDSGQVQLWNVTGRPTLVRALRGLRSINKYPEAVTTVAFSPDGRLVAAGDINHTADLAPYRLGSVAVWDVRSGKLLWKVTTKHGWVSTVTFSPDGKTIAVAREDGVVLLDDPRTGRTERTLQLEGGGIGFETAAFAADGTLATGTRAGIVELWNPATGAHIGHPTPVAAAPVASIAFAPRSDTFATTGASDGLARLWTTRTQRQFGAPLPGDAGLSGTARYTPDGSKLIIVYRSGKAFVWPVSLGAWEDHACAVAGRNLTREEWSRFVGGRRYRNVCPGLRS